MRLARDPIRITPALLFLVFMNLVPVLGVFAFGWDVGTLLLLYWLESVVIGFLNIPKILTARGAESVRGRPTPVLGRLFLSLFFSVHFGMFCFGHYSFLQNFFEVVPPLPELMGTLLSAQGVFFTASGFLISHLISMMINFYGKGEYLSRTPNTQMFMPYARIFIMHIVIIFGGLLVQMFGEPLFALLLLLALKTLIDVVSHNKEHAGGSASIKES